MKKVLLATTALVATAGFAAADITITGSANMGLRYIEDSGAGNKDSDITTHTEIDFNIVASGTSDSGVEFGASMDIDGGERDQVVGNTVLVNDTGTDNEAARLPATPNDAEVYVSYNGFTVTMGAVSNAGVVLNVSDVGFDGLDTDGYVDFLDSDDLSLMDMDVHASYTISGITVAASVGSDSEDMGVSVSGEYNGVTFGLGYSEAGGAGVDAKFTSLGLGYTTGAITVQALVVQGTGDTVEAALGEKFTNYGLSASYTSGAMTVTAAYSDSDLDDTDAAYGVGVSYDLGGGLKVAGGVGSIAGNTAADLGLTMSF